MLWQRDLAGYKLERQEILCRSGGEHAVKLCLMRFAKAAQVGESLTGSRAPTQHSGEAAPA